MRICPNCGEENPQRAKFCLRCGSSLAGSGDSGGEERKIVTVMFCEAVGFSAGDSADPEDTKASLDPFHAALQRDIEGHGGTVDKFMGLHARGRCLLQMGERTEAGESLLEAREVLAALDARPLLAQVGDLLAIAEAS